MDVRFVDSAPREMASRLHGRPFDHWRYRELLPLPFDARLPPLSVGWTPIHEAPRLATWLGVRRAVVQDDGRNPSGSLKDRASSVGVALAVAAGSERIVCASTGNAASSTACMAASMGLPATIFVPKRAPDPKIAQLRVFGAQVFRVDADYDRTWELCAEVASTRPWFNRNCAVNPYLVEGKKTVALELAERLGEDMPDWVAVSVGDGCTVAGVVKGLEQACEAGLIAKIPQVLAVQADGASPLVRAFHEGVEPVVPSVSTVADSLAVGHPRNAKKALDSVRRVNGTYVAVSDDEILDALRESAERTGVFAEPAGATAAAGVRRAVQDGVLGPSASVAVIVTGNGLKDPQTALSAVTGPIDVRPNVASVLAALD